MINDAQHKNLEKLWQQYGHSGAQFTIGNHKLIQRLLFVEGAELEESIARYNTMMDNDPDKSITPDCIAAIKRVLT